MPKHYKLGTTAGQKEKMEQLVVEAGVHSNTWQAHALDNGSLSTLIRAAAAGRTIRIGKRIPAYDPSTGIYRFDMDFGMEFSAMIEEGDYDWVHPDITPEHFPITGEGLVEFEGKLLDLSMPSSNTDEESVKHTNPARLWTFATIAVLLGFGASFPEVQRKRTVIGLGSEIEVNDDRKVPYLYGNEVMRGLNLCSCDLPWVSTWRFLGVRPALATTSA